MAKLNSIGVFILIIFPQFELMAQQSAYYAIFRENWVLLNPAFLDHFFLEDKERTLMVNASYRQQWIGFEDGPKQLNARLENIVVGKKGADKNIPFWKWGFGIGNEKIATFNSCGLYGNYAYLMQLNEQTHMAAGFSASIFNHRFRLDPDAFQDFEADPLAQSVQGSIRWLANLDAGVFLKHKSYNGQSGIDHWYLGMAATQVLSVNIRTESENGVLATDRKPHFNLLTGVLFGRGGRAVVTSFWEPSVWIRYLPGTSYQTILGNSPLSADLALRFSIGDKFWSGLGFGTSGNLSIEFGYNYHNAFQRKDTQAPKVKTGMLFNAPLIGPAPGYSVELFMGVALASY